MVDDINRTQAANLQQGSELARLRKEFETLVCVATKSTSVNKLIVLSPEDAFKFITLNSINFYCV